MTEDWLYGGYDPSRTITGECPTGCSYPEQVGAHKDSLQREADARGMSLEELLSDLRERYAQEQARRKTKRRRKNPASSIREDAYYREIADLLRTMPSDWRRQYRSGKDKLSAIGGPVLPAGTSAASAPSPEQAMLLIGITAGGNPSKDTPFGPHKVPKAVREAAMKGIRLSHANNYGAWDFIGLARAIELVIVPSVSDTSFKRMGKYLFRHKKDARASGFGDDENPSRGYMAWLNWGGDPAVTWTGAFEKNPRKERTDAERALAVTRTGHTVAVVGRFATRKAAPGVAARVAATTAGRFGARVIPGVGQALMAVGAGKEAYKVGRRRYKEGWRSGSVTRDAAKVTAGAFGLEDFIPDAPAKKNPRTSTGRTSTGRTSTGRTSTGRTVVFFDMDETLLHSDVQPLRRPDVHRFRADGMVYWTVARPDAERVLAAAREMFDEVYLFTAAQQGYAHAALDATGLRGYFDGVYTANTPTRDLPDVSGARWVLIDDNLSIAAWKLDSLGLRASKYTDHWQPVRAYLGGRSDDYALPEALIGAFERAQRQGRK